jgi:hypothetical protein
MKIIINVVLGLLLFVGALVGGLAATGRLTHEGTANIPVLGGFFPAPPESTDPEHPNDSAAHGEAGKEGAAADAHGAPGGEATNADHSGGLGTPQEASGVPQEPQGEESPRRMKSGKSVVQPEAKAESGGHGGGEGGGGHGDAPAGHGDATPEHGTKPAKEAGAHEPKREAGGPPNPERDFGALEQSLANDRKNKYSPGGYFTFAGMPAGLTAEQINEAWQRVQGVLTELDQRKTALDLREKDLQVLSDDIDNRIRRIAEERLHVETMARQLDERIAKFQEQVKLVRNDEVAALKRNAVSYASFERKTAADLLSEQWRTDSGRDMVLKTFEFMDKDAVNEILAAMDPKMTQDVMAMRLRVSKEAAPSAGPGK